MSALFTTSDHDQVLFGALMVQHSVDAMFLAAPDGRILLANAAASALFGYSNEEFAKGGCQLITDDGDPGIATLTRRKEEGGTARTEGWMRRKDGSRFCAEITRAAFQDDMQDRIAITVRDISDRTVQNHFEKLVTTAVNQSQQVICVLDADWRIVWANAATFRISEYSSKDLIGRRAPMHEYITEKHPMKFREILRSLDHTGHWSGEVVSRRRNGQIYPLLGSISRVTSEQSEVFHYVLTLTDVGTVRDNERKLYEIMHYDPLTRLPNKDYFLERSFEFLLRARSKGERTSLAILDVDRFRDIIEAYGYDVADATLLELADRLKAHIGPDALIARHADDTFVALIRSPDTEAERTTMIEGLLKYLKRPMTVNGIELRLRISMGVNHDVTVPENMTLALRKAQMAMHEAKHTGGNTYAVFREGIEYSGSANLRILNDLRRALEEGRITTFFQPILCGATNKVIAMEALVRCIGPDGAIIGPERFIDVAENNDVINELTDLVLRSACAQLHELDARGHREIPCSVNLSAQQFRDPHLHDRLGAIIRQAGIAPHRIKFEITERVFLTRGCNTERIIAGLRTLGTGIVIDDFGTGHSSFSYLKHFPIDGIKLDRLFLSDTPGQPRSEKIVRAIMSIAQELGMSIVAEGVETQPQADFLNRLNCGAMQGFLFSPPVPGDAFLGYLSNHAPAQTLN